MSNNRQKLKELAITVFLCLQIGIFFTIYHYRESLIIKAEDDILFMLVAVFITVLISLAVVCILTVFWAAANTILISLREIYRIIKSKKK